MWGWRSEWITHYDWIYVGITVFPKATRVNLSLGWWSWCWEKTVLEWSALSKPRRTV